jgi:hypothetical protein
MINCELSLDNGGQGWSYSSMDNQTHSNGEPLKSNYGNLPVSQLVGEPSPTQILSELNRSKCLFQAMTIASFMKGEL